MKRKKKLKTILIDLDGVLNKYNGKYDAENFIPMKSVKVPKNLSKNFMEHYVIKIFTTRNKILTVKWLMKYRLDKYIKRCHKHQRTCLASY